jgi:gliding motility-associated lipoprotein GldH
MKRKSSFIFILLVSLVFSACEKPPTFEKSYAFSKKQWNQQVKPTFTVAIMDTSKEYDFVLTIRTTTDYKYSNLWMYWNTKTPDGQKAREPFEVKIANSDGSWIGKKTGTIVENALYFKRRKMPLKGKYIFTLEQGITNSSIDEILDVSLLVQEVKETKK